MLRALKILLFLLLVAFLAALLYGYARHHPQDLPWTGPDLTQPIGAFTGRKLAALHRQPARCEALLSKAGIRFAPLPPRGGEQQCGYDDAVRFETGGALEIGWRPASLGISCPMASGLALWEWNVVQPAALRHFGAKVVQIDHYGSYSCRRINGRPTGDWSEHAHANAVDVAGFKLSDGRRVSVVKSWTGSGQESAFLHEVRDGACSVFSTVLSPDYNAAHHDHLHLDQASRGAMGWRACR